MAFGLPEKFSWFLCIIGSVAVGCAAGGFLKPWVPAISNGVANIGYTSVAILAFTDSAPGAVHDIAPALGIWSRVAFVAISSGSCMDKASMFLVNDL